MSEELRLTEEDRQLVEQAARAAHTDPKSLLHKIVTDFVGSSPAVRSTPDVMGGDFCVRNTRIPVWMLVSYKRQGMTDTELLANYPGLSAADLIAVWDYYAAHSEEIEAQRKRHEEAA